MIDITAGAAAASAYRNGSVRSLIRQWEEAAAAWKIESRIDADNDVTEASGPG